MKHTEELISRPVLLLISAPELLVPSLSHRIGCACEVSALWVLSLSLISNCSENSSALVKPGFSECSLGVQQLLLEIMNMEILDSSKLCKTQNEKCKV